MLSAFSHSPWVTVSPDWEILSSINVDAWTPLNWNSSNNPSRYSAQVKNIVMSVIPQLWEDIVAKYLWWKLFKWKSHDVETSSWKKVEVKTWRVWSSVSIRQKQLESLWEWDIYALLYYEMSNNYYPPSHYVNRAINEDYPIWPEKWLVKNIRWRTLFLIQRPSIVNFFNTSNLRLFRNSWWQPYKSLSRRSAYKLFEENPDWLIKKKQKHRYWNHNLEVYKLWRGL